MLHSLPIICVFEETGNPGEKGQIQGKYGGRARAQNTHARNPRGADAWRKSRTRAVFEPHGEPPFFAPFYPSAKRAARNAAQKTPAPRPALTPTPPGPPSGHPWPAG
jgi:hypothetical protein